MRILGIDPGYAIMGWAVLDHKGNHFKEPDLRTAKAFAWLMKRSKKKQENGS